MLYEIWESVWKQLSRELVVRGAFFLPDDRRRRLERHLRGREEVRRLGLADGVIVSFGKSGRTWLRVLLSRFFQKRFDLADSAFIGFDNLHRRDARVPRLLFTHDNYLRDYTGHRDDKRDYYDKRTVLLVRHPADVAVSQYFQWKFRMRAHKKALNSYPEHGREVAVFDFVMDADAGLDKVIDFLNAWGQERGRIADLLVVRYEDLRASTAGELGRTLRFLNQEPSHAELEDCVAFASVENMRALETKKVFWLAGSRMKAKDAANPNSFKVRRGKVGGWKDYFEDHQVRVIERRIEERLLPGFGYLAGEQEAPAVAAAAGA